MNPWRCFPGNTILWPNEEDFLFQATGLRPAISAAGLVEKLEGKGPYTIFAPTDEAFAKLPDGTMEDLLKPANKAKLAGFLANHVVPGTCMAAELKNMKAANGRRLGELKEDPGVFSAGNVRTLRLQTPQQPLCMRHRFNNRVTQAIITPLVPSWRLILPVAQSFQ